jgi:hypothetical protein
MIVTLCGNPVNDSDCMMCLQMKDCRDVRETICRGCIREGKCPGDFRHKKVSDGMCRGRELESTQMRTSEKDERDEWIEASLKDFTRLNGKGF